MGMYRCGKCKKTFYFDNTGYGDISNKYEPYKKAIAYFTHKEPEKCPHCGARFSRVDVEF